MRISSSSTGDSTTLPLHSSRVDAAIAAELRSSLGEAVTATTGPTVIDLSDVTVFGLTCLDRSFIILE